jgi:hypothetical protein
LEGYEKSKPLTTTCGGAIIQTGVIQIAGPQAASVKLPIAVRKHPADGDEGD